MGAGIGSPEIEGPSRHVGIPSPEVCMGSSGKEPGRHCCRAFPKTGASPAPIHQGLHTGAGKVPVIRSVENAGTRQKFRTVRGTGISIRKIRNTQFVLVGERYHLTSPNSSRIILERFGRTALGNRPMAGHLTLDQVILVRIQVPQP